MRVAASPFLNLFDIFVLVVGMSHLHTLCASLLEFTAMELVM